MCEVLTLTNSLDVRCWHWSLNSLLESVGSWDFPLKGRSVVFNWAFISRFAFLFITLFHYCPSLLALSCCFLLPLILLPFITHLHVDVRQYPVHITCSPLSCFYYFILLWAQYMCSHILLVLATHSHTSHAAKKLQNQMLWMYRGLGSMHLMISCCSLAINVPSSHGDGVWNVSFVYVAIQKKIYGPYHVMRLMDKPPNLSITQTVFIYKAWPFCFILQRSSDLGTFFVKGTVSWVWVYFVDKNNIALIYYN